MKRSIASGGVFALAAGGQRALTFLLLPVYTAALTPSQYGRVGVLVAVSAITYAIFSLGFDFAVVRQYFAYKDDVEGRDRFVSSVWIFQFLCVPALGVVVAAALLLFAPTTSIFRPAELATAVMVSTVQVVAVTVPLAVLRASQKLRPYLVLTSSLGIGNAAFTVLFVVAFGWGVIGYLAGTLCANLVALVVALLVIDWSPTRRLDVAAIRQTVALGVPLIPGGIAGLSLQVGARLVLAGRVASSLVGVYTLGANLAVPAQVGLQSLNQGFMPAYAQLQHEPDNLRPLRRTITLQASASIWVGIGLALVGPPLVTIIAPDSYAEAASVIPWLTLGYVFYGLSLIPLNGLMFILGRPQSAAAITVVSAAVTLSLVAILTGPYGIQGAAAASAIGYLVQAGLTAWAAWAAGIRYSIDWARILAVAGWAAVAYVAADVLTQPTGVDALAARVVLALLLTGVIGLTLRTRGLMVGLRNPT